MNISASMRSIRPPCPGHDPAAVLGAGAALDRATRPGRRRCRAAPRRARARRPGRAAGAGRYHEVREHDREHAARHAADRAFPGLVGRDVGRHLARRRTPCRRGSARRSSPPCPRTRRASSRAPPTARRARARAGSPAWRGSRRCRAGRASSQAMRVPAASLGSGRLMETSMDPRAEDEQRHLKGHAHVEAAVLRVEEAAHDQRAQHSPRLQQRLAAASSSRTARGPRCRLPAPARSRPRPSAAP